MQTMAKLNFGKPITYVFGMATMVYASLAFTQDGSVSVSESAQKAINSNPEVQARWHDFLASTEQQTAAIGGYGPQVDLSATLGHDRQYFRDNQSSDTSFRQRGISLTYNQMVYDGFATRSLVDSLAYSARVNFYKLLDSTEQFSLEAYRAHEDVLRYRALLELARDNLEKHKDVFKLITKRVKAGVGRSVDLEQVTGRLALAESNVLTETSNLHDVSARYQRITGEAPAPRLAASKLGTDILPDSLDQALNRAYANNPAHLATVENIRAANKDVEGRRAKLKPRLDFRVRSDYGEDINRIDGESSELTAELVMSYNIFRGGSDVATVREFVERMSLAEDLRDKSCRDVRQTLAIALNDVKRIGQQLTFLEQHQLSIAKARQAYRKQFDIGQRTLLDLLDTENEYFEAHRAYLNGKYDHSIARARVLTAMGELTRALQITRSEMPSLPEVYNSEAGLISVGGCANPAG